jgi:hypothetical protein
MGSAAKVRFEQRFSVKQMVDQYQECFDVNLTDYFSIEYFKFTFNDGG